MRALIIEDKDAEALLKSLELAKFRGSMLRSKDGVTEAQIDSMHRHFHLYVCRWLTDVGWNGVR